jgi:hypothetical protein
MILSRFGPSGVVINEDLEVLQGMQGSGTPPANRRGSGQCLNRGRITPETDSYQAENRRILTMFSMDNFSFIPKL